MKSNLMKNYSARHFGKKDQTSKVHWKRKFKAVADPPKFTWDFQMAFAT
jgi:hypothetical protein